MNRSPIYNRRKQILIGTDQKCNPTKLIAQREVQILQLLEGKATIGGLYNYMLSICDNEGRFIRFNAELARAVGCSTPTIDRWIRQMKKVGVLSSRVRGVNNLQVANEYTLNRIDDTFARSIKSDTSIKADTTSSIKADRQKTALKENDHSTSSCVHPSSLSSTGAKHTETACASHPATEGSAPKVKEMNTSLDKQILQWITEHREFIEQRGFIPKSSTSLLKDMKEFFTTQDGQEDTEGWTLFRDEWWTAISIKLSVDGFISTQKHKLGFGWVFKTNPASGELNLQRLLFGNDLIDYTLPETVFNPGDIIRDTCRNRPAKVLSRSVHSYKVCSPKLTDPTEMEENSYTLGFSQAREQPSVRLQEPEGRPGTAPVEMESIVPLSDSTSERLPITGNTGTVSQSLKDQEDERRLRIECGIEDEIVSPVFPVVMAPVRQQKARGGEQLMVQLESLLSKNQDLKARNAANTDLV